MGKGDHLKGNTYFKLVALYNFILNAVVALFIYLNRDILARVYTSDLTLIPDVMNGYTVMTVVLMIHGLAMVQAGALRGLGMLELATLMVLFAFYGVALPAAYLFAFVYDMKMVGLWWGVVAGAVSEILLYLIIFQFFCNWEQLA
jgi:multidrug resistance protein, MATE family